MILEEILMAKDSASAEPGAKELPFSTYTQPNPRQCTDAIKKKSSWAHSNFKEKEQKPGQHWAAQARERWCIAVPAHKWQREMVGRPGELSVKV